MIKTQVDPNALYDRHKSLSYKWNRYGGDILPLWVADMDYPCSPAIIDAIKERLNHPIFGYEDQPESLKQAVVQWIKKRHKWHLSIEDIQLFLGVVSNIHFILSVFSKPGDGVLTFTPIYPPFLAVHKHKSLSLACVDMVLSGDWKIDWDKVQEAISPKTRFLLLCSPHNPTGRVWREKELLKMIELARQHELIIISDEIWCDLSFDGSKHIPIANLKEAQGTRIFTLLAPSKTFNIPGLGLSYCIVSDPKDRALLKSRMPGFLPEINTLSMVAAEAAYREGEPWLKLIKTQLKKNRERVVSFLNHRFAGKIETARPEASYLQWFRLKSHRGSSLYEHFLSQAKIALSDGRYFGENFANWVRLNFATSEKILEEALERIKQTLNK